MVLIVLCQQIFGEKFDPNIHEAIFQAKIPNKESGTICNVNQIGYKLKEV